MAIWKEHVGYYQQLGIKAVSVMELPYGNTAARPAGEFLSQGSFRINSELNNIEWFDGAIWRQPGGGGGGGDFIVNSLTEQPTSNFHISGTGMAQVFQAADTIFSPVYEAVPDTFGIGQYRLSGISESYAIGAFAATTDASREVYTAVGTEVPYTDIPVESAAYNYSIRTGEASAFKTTFWRNGNLTVGVTGDQLTHKFSVQGDSKLNGTLTVGSLAGTDIRNVQVTNTGLLIAADAGASSDTNFATHNLTFAANRAHNLANYSLSLNNLFNLNITQTVIGNDNIIDTTTAKETFVRYAITNTSAHSNAAAGFNFINNTNDFFQAYLGSSNNVYTPRGVYMRHSGTGDFKIISNGDFIVSNQVTGSLNQFLKLSKTTGIAYLHSLNDTTGVAKMVITTNGVLSHQAIPSGGGTYSVENGLSPKTGTPTTFQLGGTLLQNTTITGNNFNFIVNDVNVYYLNSVDGATAYVSGSGTNKQSKLGVFDNIQSAIVVADMATAGVSRAYLSAGSDGTFTATVTASGTDSTASMHGRRIILTTDIVQAGSGLFITTLPNVATANVLFYDPATGKVTYGAAPSGGGGDTNSYVTTLAIDYEAPLSTDIVLTFNDRPEIREAFIGGQATLGAIPFYNGSNLAWASGARSDGNRFTMAGSFRAVASAVPASPINGEWYYSSATNLFQFYQNGVWVGLGGSSSDTNFATTNLTSTANRVHTFTGHTLEINDTSYLKLSAKSVATPALNSFMELGSSIGRIYLNEGAGYGQLVTDRVGSDFRVYMVAQTAGSAELPPQVAIRSGTSEVSIYGKKFSVYVSAGADTFTGGATTANNGFLLEQLPASNSSASKRMLVWDNITKRVYEQAVPSGGGGSSEIETVATFAAITGSTKRFIYVAADETNNGDQSLYLHTGSALKFLLTIA